MSNRAAELFEATQVNRALGLRLVRSEDGNGIVEMDAPDSFTQEKGVIHGGIIATLADTAAVYSFMPNLPETSLCASIEFKVNFLAPAMAGAGNLIAEGKTIKKGTRVVICESIVRQGTKQIALGLFTYLVWQKQ